MLKRPSFFLFLCFLISGILLWPSHAFLDHGGVHWRVIGRGKVTPLMCPAPQRPPVVNGGGGECSLGISRPSRTDSFSGLRYCAYDNDDYAHPTQSWLGQGFVGNVWGEPLTFRVHNKLWAMSSIYAAEHWAINPNFLFAVAIKESRAPENCVPSQGNVADGCFQIEPTTGFAEIRQQWPQYMSNGVHSELVQNYPTEVVLASLYFNWEDRFWLSRIANWQNFRENSADQEAKARMLAWGYNRGAYGSINETIIDNCPLSETDITNCVRTFAPGEDVGLDYMITTSSYCRILSGSSDLYEAQLSWADLQAFINETLRPTYAGTLTPNWTAIGARGRDAFNCLEQSGAISFRYDFKTWLRQILPILP